MKTEKTAQTPAETNNLRFDQFFIKRCKALEEETDYNNRQRTAMAILMNKRNRGDMFGFIPDWDNFSSLEYVEVSENGLMKWNIFEPIVRANNANALNVNLRFVWEAATGDPDAEAGAELANSLLDNYLRPRYYTEDRREGMCELAQLSHGFFLYSGFDPRATSFKIRKAKTKTIDVPIGYEMLRCACGFKIPKKDYDEERKMNTQMMADDATDQVASAIPPEMMQPDQQQMTQGGQPETGTGVNPGALLEQILRSESEAINNAPAECPECGNVMTVEGRVENSREDVPDGFEEISAGDFATELVTSFEILIDERNAKRGNCDDAHWLCWRHLLAYYDLETRYPGLLDDLKHQTESDWSDATRWLRALETSGDVVRRSNSALSGIDRLFEVKEWWFLPQACGSRVEPEGWKLEDNTGKVLFEIKKGETVKDACLRQFGKFEGLKLDILGEEIVGVASDYKNERWKSGSWIVNATSFWGKGQESLLDLQKATNDIFNLLTEHIAYESSPMTIVDGMMFDGEDLVNQPGYVNYTRPGFVRDRPIADYIYSPQPKQLGAESFNLFAYILGTGKQEMSGVYPSSVGGSDPNVKTKGGQQMTIQRALGLQTAYFKSEKRAIRGFFENLTKIFQDKMPKEAYSYVKAPNGEELKELDIEIFRTLRVGRDIILKEVEGTDLPQTHVEMRENYGMALQLGLFAPAEMTGLPPEIQSKMLKMLRIEWDANNFNDHRRIAYIRLKKMKEECYARGEEAMREDGSLDPNLMTEILAPLPFLARQDNHLVHIGILDAFCVAESAQTNPSLLFIACLQQRAMQHHAAMAEAQSEAVNSNAAIEGTAEKMRRLTSGEEELEQETNQRDEKSKEKANQPKPADETAILTQLLGAEENDRGRQHESVEKEKDRKHQKEIAKNKNKK